MMHMNQRQQYIQAGGLTKQQIINQRENDLIQRLKISQKKEKRESPER